MSLKALAFGTVALLGATAQETPISMGCLSETVATGKDADDEPNYQPYRRSNFLESSVMGQMRISEITTCVGDPDGNLKGFRLKLCDQNDSSNCVDLPWMGKENREICYTDQVPGPITSITTTTNGKFVNSIVWRSGDWVADYSIPDGEDE